MPPAHRSNGTRDLLASNDLAVFGSTFIVHRQNDREREHDPRRSKVGVDFDLGGCVALAQFVEDGVNMWPQPLVGLPGNPTRNDEISSNLQEVFGHTQ